MFKNVGSQSWTFYERDYSTGAPKTGDSANIVPYVSLDDAAAVAVAATPTEIDATHLPGWYNVVLAVGETNGTKLLLGAKSSTANTECRGEVLWTKVDSRPVISGH